MTKADKKRMRRKMQKWAFWGYCVPMAVRTVVREYRLVKGV